jgi:hypothetical protein
MNALMLYVSDATSGTATAPGVWGMPPVDRFRPVVELPEPVSLSQAGNASYLAAARAAAQLLGQIMISVKYPEPPSHSFARPKRVYTGRARIKYMGRGKILS